MEEYIQSALDIVKAQASARPMTEDEIIVRAHGISSA